MQPEGNMTIKSPFQPEFSFAYSTERKPPRRLQIEAWGQIKKDRKPQVGDRWISLLHHGDIGVILFYVILPRRED
jgi:hypothetical protein